RAGAVEVVLEEEVLGERAEPPAEAAHVSRCAGESQALLEPGAGRGVLAGAAEGLGEGEDDARRHGRVADLAPDREALLERGERGLDALVTRPVERERPQRRGAIGRALARGGEQR